MGKYMQLIHGCNGATRGFSLQVSHHATSQGKNMARPLPYKNSLRTCCLSLFLLACTASGLAQDNNARKVVKKAPVPYPSILKSRGIGGTVRLKVFVKPDGTVRDTEVLGGNPILAESAQKSVTQWKFSPGSSETAIEISVIFDPHAESGS
jgi:TonB family protein